MRTFKPLLALFAVSLAAGQVLANDCEVEIAGDDMMKFSETQITVPASCEEIKLTLTHSGKLPVNVMGHNWVLAETEGWRELAQAGQAAGLDKEYLPDDKTKIIAHTDLIGGGESTSITFDLSDLDKGTEYTYFCSFPGHWAQMNGKFIIE